MDWLKSVAFLTDRQKTSVLSSGAGMPTSVPSAGKGHTLQQSAQDSQVVRNPVVLVAHYLQGGAVVPNMIFT